MRVVAFQYGHDRKIHILVHHSVMQFDIVELYGLLIDMVCNYWIQNTNTMVLLILTMKGKPDTQDSPLLGSREGRCTQPNTRKWRGCFRDLLQVTRQQH